MPALYHSDYQPVGMRSQSIPRPISIIIAIIAMHFNTLFYTYTISRKQVWVCPRDRSFGIRTNFAQFKKDIPVCPRAFMEAEVSSTKTIVVDCKLCMPISPRLCFCIWDFLHSSIWTIQLLYFVPAHRHLELCMVVTAVWAPKLALCKAIATV